MHRGLRASLPEQLLILLRVWSSPASSLSWSFTASLRSVLNRHFPVSIHGFSHKKGTHASNGHGYCRSFAPICLIPLQVQSSVYLFSFHPFSHRKKFSRSPHGLWIKTTRKDTPGRVTPTHLPLADARPAARRPPHARGAPGWALGPRAGGRTGRRGGAGLRPAARGPGPEPRAVSPASGRLASPRWGARPPLPRKCGCLPAACRTLHARLGFDPCNLFPLIQHWENSPSLTDDKGRGRGEKETPCLNCWDLHRREGLSLWRWLRGSTVLSGPRNWESLWRHQRKLSHLSALVPNSYHLLLLLSWINDWVFQRLSAWYFAPIIKE